jgi:peptidoglycan hydrolase-like protein with peptidoglycan-binding domain
MENPASSGGLLVMALTASAIVVNATMLQPTSQSRHNNAGAPAVATAVPTPRPRDPLAAEVSRLTAQPNPPGIATALLRSPVEGSPSVIADIQRELAKRGLYGGTVDGIAGSRTRTAVVAYQNAIGIAATGVASPELLVALRQPAAPKPSAAAIPRATPVPPAAIPAAATAVHPRPGDAAPSEAYRKVQLALNQIGYGPIPVDGRGGAETADAIRRFELDYGLAVTGIPSEAVTKRLIAIGALAPR